MFNFTPVTATQVIAAMANHMPPVQNWAEDMDVSHAINTNEILAEEIASSSTADYSFLSDFYYLALSTLDNHSMEYDLQRQNLAKVYAELFTQEIADDLSQNWAKVA